MSMALTTQAVSLALDIAEARAQAASRAIANASQGGLASRPHFAAALAVLREAAANPAMSAQQLRMLGQAALRIAPEDVGPAQPVQLDREVSDLALATLDYRALTDGLNRQFGLMSLAIGGK